MFRFRRVFMTTSGRGALALVDGLVSSMLPTSQSVGSGFVEGIGKEECTGRLVLMGLVVVCSLSSVGRVVCTATVGRLVFGWA